MQNSLAMKVLYDDQIFTTQKFGGISRYFVELIKHLPPDIEWEESVRISRNVYLKGDKFLFPNLASLGPLNNISLIRKSANRFSSKSKEIKGDYDILHPTYYGPSFLKYNQKPYVLTVHDMIHELFPQYFSHDRIIEDKLKTIRNATRIIAVSQNTKDDLVKILNINPDIIDVVWHGHSVSMAAAEEIPNLPERYVLFTGQRGAYKNFDRLAKAFAIAREKDKSLHLICTGKPLKKGEIQMLRDLKIADVVHHYFATDGQLTYLYNHALCFVFPSCYEGFGIPILEAFAAETPLLLSDTSCFPEIAAEAGYYFNPEDEQSMAKAISEVCADPVLRANLIEKGTRRLQTFSWQKMAQETADVYRKITFP